MRTKIEIDAMYQSIATLGGGDVLPKAAFDALFAGRAFIAPVSTATAEIRRRAESWSEAGDNLNNLVKTTPEYLAECLKRMSADVLGLLGDINNLRANGSVAELDALVNRYIREIAELGDRTSPEDNPDMLLILPSEIAMLLKNFAAEAADL